MILIIKTAVILISSIIGAAFASGKEIQIFFGGGNAIFAITLSIIMFLFVPLKIYIDLIKHNSENFTEFVKTKFKRNYKLILIISTVFSLSIYCSMVNGANVILPGFGGVLLILLCLIILFFDLKGIEFLSLFSTPLLIIGITLNCYLTITASTFDSVKSYSYSLYNILSAFPLMCSFKKYFKNKHSAIISSIISGSVLSFLLLLIYFCLPEQSFSMPMLTVAMKNSIGTFYKLIIFIAIFTTAVSSAKGFVESVKTNRIPSLIFLTVCGLLLSLLGFDKIVELITSIFGFIGIIVITYVVLTP